MMTLVIFFFFVIIMIMITTTIKSRSSRVWTYTGHLPRRAQVSNMWPIFFWILLKTKVFTVVLPFKKQLSSSLDWISEIVHLSGAWQGVGHLNQKTPYLNWSIPSTQQSSPSSAIFTNATPLSSSTSINLTVSSQVKIHVENQDQDQDQNRRNTSHQCDWRPFCDQNSSQSFYKMLVRFSRSLTAVKVNQLKIYTYGSEMTNMQILLQTCDLNLPWKRSKIFE